jgi:pre-mRNA-splicing helicase BRR2
VDQLQPILEEINKRALVESLQRGIGYIHEALDAFDKRAVQHLFKIGAIQVLLVSRDCAWEVEASSHLVIVMGTQFFEGREHRYLDYPICEVLRCSEKSVELDETRQLAEFLWCPLSSENTTRNS